MTSVAEKNEDSELFLIVVISNGRFNDTWVLDNACTFQCLRKGFGLLPMSESMMI